jgi:hypothetical protein
MLSIVARRAGRIAVGIPLATLYTIGIMAAAVAIACVTCVAAVRLGWSDMRKRAEHGAA